VEIEVLRTQMNPHFIFNCLTSINLFILKNDCETASFYLNKFARLMRQVLEYSDSELITLKEELDTLILYIDLEKMRYGQHFDYRIAIDKNLNTQNCPILPLILQPYVENAIWYGLKHKKKGKGFLDIQVFEKDHYLNIIIEDNGIGRAQSLVMHRQRSSFCEPQAIAVAEERIAGCHAEYGLDARVDIVDIGDKNGVAQGTRVVLRFELEA
jgi:LytS/YehU family sensor histidine kinase